MKPLTQFILLVLSSSYVSAFVLPLQDTNHIPSRQGHLKPRAGDQSTADPDNEPPYTDVDTGNAINKSPILVGVGPSAADNRYFDWDATCSDAGQRTRIILAWDAFQDLTTSSSQRLKDLMAALPNQPVATSGNPNAGNRAFIFTEDPAYTQMFKARDTGLQYVVDSYDSITNNVQNFPARGGNAPGALRFICNADGHVLDGAGDPFCV